MNISHVILFAVFILSTSPKPQKEDHVCGRPNGNDIRMADDRVVGGYDIGYYRYSWYAALIRYKSVSCGGALIGPRTVVTAAHCYKEYLDLASKGYLRLEKIYTVKLGIYNICHTEPNQREYKIEKVQVHELYYTKKPYYDICLLTLADDTSAYEPICLPYTEVKSKPKEGTVPGLGTLRYQGAMPCTLHEARVLVYNDTACHKMINDTGNNPKLIKNAFCAGYMQGGIDTCQGDSGGPLQIMNTKGDYVLLGIVSFGFHCAMPGLLGMYTDVSEYLDWIEEKSGLDAGIVNIIYNKTTTTTQKPVPVLLPINAQGPHRRRPHRRPFRIIIIKNKRSTPASSKKLVTYQKIRKKIIREIHTDKIK